MNVHSRLCPPIVVLVLALALSPMKTAAQTPDATGRVVTCPGGEPIEGAPVQVHLNGDRVAIVHTDSNGWYELHNSNWCGAFITVSIGEPTGRGCRGECCPERRVYMDCGFDPIIIADLEFECGPGKKQPCPIQE
jgi:hypothetical protein